MPNSQSYYCGSANIQGNATITGNVTFADPLGYSDLQRVLTEIQVYSKLLDLPPMPQAPGLTFCEQYAQASTYLQGLIKAYNSDIILL